MIQLCLAQELSPTICELLIIISIIHNNFSMTQGSLHCHQTYVKNSHCCFHYVFLGKFSSCSASWPTSHHPQQLVTTSLCKASPDNQDLPGRHKLEMSRIIEGAAYPSLWFSQILGDPQTCAALLVSGRFSQNLKEMKGCVHSWSLCLYSAS